MELLKVENLQRYYPKKKALDNVSFSVSPGEIVALIGRSGAGKTTLMTQLPVSAIPPEVQFITKGKIRVSLAFSSMLRF